jgi:hypothetical protein
MEWKNYAIIIFAVLMGCTADNQNVTALAIRLANEGGAEFQQIIAKVTSPAA